MTVDALLSDGLEVALFADATVRPRVPTRTRVFAWAEAHVKTRLDLMGLRAAAPVALLDDHGLRCRGNIGAGGTGRTWLAIGLSLRQIEVIRHADVARCGALFAPLW